VDVSATSDEHEALVASFESTHREGSHALGRGHSGGERRNCERYELANEHHRRIQVARHQNTDARARTTAPRVEAPARLAGATLPCRRPSSRRWRVDKVVRLFLYSAVAASFFYFTNKQTQCEHTRTASHRGYCPPDRISRPHMGWECVGLSLAVYLDHVVRPTFLCPSCPIGELRIHALL
jgi:hypothetical protein